MLGRIDKCSRKELTTAGSGAGDSWQAAATSFAQAAHRFKPPSRKPNRSVTAPKQAGWQMLEYIKAPIAKLAESVINPVAEWLLCRNWLFRAVTLLLAFFAVALVTQRQEIDHLYHQGLFTAGAVASSGHIFLRPETSDKLSATISRLDSTISTDLLTFDRLNLAPWTIAQTLVAAEGKTPDPITADRVLKYIRSKVEPNCFCWADVVATHDRICTAITGWVMAAFAATNTAISDADLQAILSEQAPEGWWPPFHDKTEAEFASTYATAWVLLGLKDLRDRTGIPETLKPQVDAAIARGGSWLLKTRNHSGSWSLYPKMTDVTDSPSVSGLVLHTLHRIYKNDLRTLDEAWLGGLTTEPPGASAGENNYIELRGSGIERIDDFVQLPLPWMLIATVDAYGNGDVFQRARASYWVDAALSADDVQNSDARLLEWRRAELLFALRYVANSVKAR